MGSVVLVSCAIIKLVKFMIFPHCTTSIVSRTTRDLLLSFARTMSKSSPLPIQSHQDDESKVNHAADCNTKLKQNEFYHIRPIQPFGAAVTNIDLSSTKLSTKLIDCIRSDIHKYQLLVFKNQAPSTNHVIPPMIRVCNATSITIKYDKQTRTN